MSYKDDSLFNTIEYDSHLREKQKARDRWDNKHREKEKTFKRHIKFDDDYDGYFDYKNYYGYSSNDEGEIDF